MRPTIHISTNVVEDGKLELKVDSLRAGQAVDVTIELPENGHAQPDATLEDRRKLAEWLRSLPVNSDAEYWKRREQELQEGKDSWD
jgi:hypothetical protein